MAARPPPARLPESPAPGSNPHRPRLPSAASPAGCFPGPRGRSRSVACPRALRRGSAPLGSLERSPATLRSHEDRTLLPLLVPPGPGARLLPALVPCRRRGSLLEHLLRRAHRRAIGRDDGDPRRRRGGDAARAHRSDALHRAHASGGLDGEARGDARRALGGPRLGDDRRWRRRQGLHGHGGGARRNAGAHGGAGGGDAAGLAGRGALPGYRCGGARAGAARRAPGLCRGDASEGRRPRRALGRRGLLVVRQRRAHRDRGPARAGAQGLGGRGTRRRSALHRRLLALAAGRRRRESAQPRR